MLLIETDNFVRRVRQVVRVVDGDTYELLIDLGFRVYVRAMIRVAGIDTAELSTEEGHVARDAAITLLAACRNVVIRSYLNRAETEPVKSFDRWVADVYLDGENIITHLTAKLPPVIIAKMTRRHV